MTPEQTPDELRELLGAYALNAIDPDERAQVDALLLADASARAELHELQHAAAWLGHASLRPPASAWDAITAEVDRDHSAAEHRLRRSPSADRSDRDHSAAEGRLRRSPSADRSDRDHSAPEGRLRRSPSAEGGVRRISRWLVAAAAVVVLAVGAAGVFALVDRTSNPDSVATQFQAALRNPSARQVKLRSRDGTYSARAVVLRDRTGYLAHASLPRLESGRDFQLWSITPDGPVSVGLLRGRGDVHRFRVADATTALAVTNEPRGGSPAPTGTPIVSGDLGSA